MPSVVCETEGEIHKIPLAGIGYAQPPDSLMTLLGSCVGIVIRDHLTRLVSLAHVVLPESQGDEKHAWQVCRYGDRRDASRDAAAWSPSRAVAGQIGRAEPRCSVMRHRRTLVPEISKAVKKYLAEHQIPIISEHLGGTTGRGDSCLGERWNGRSACSARDYRGTLVSLAEVPFDSYEGIRRHSALPSLT